MNVINKLLIFIVFMLISGSTLLSSDMFSNEISIGIGLKYGKDTVNRHNFEWLPILGYKFYFLKQRSEIILGSNPEEYDGEYKSAPKTITHLKSSLFIDSFIKLKFSDSYTYGDFLEQEKSYFDLYLGIGYLMHMKKRMYMSFYGGGNFYKETSKKSFNEDNASPDLVMTYEGNEHSFIDYGGYLGFDTIFFLSKMKTRNFITFSISFIYNYKIVMNEHDLISTLNFGFKF